MAVPAAMLLLPLLLLLLAVLFTHMRLTPSTTVHIPMGDPDGVVSEEDDMRAPVAVFVTVIIGHRRTAGAVAGRSATPALSVLLPVLAALCTLVALVAAAGSRAGDISSGVSLLMSPSSSRITEGEGEEE